MVGMLLMNVSDNLNAEQLSENKGRSLNLLVFFLVKMVTSISLFWALL